MIRLMLLRISVLRNIVILLGSIIRLLRSIIRLLRNVTWLLRSIGRLLRNIGRLLWDVIRLLGNIGRLLRRIHWLRGRNGLSRLCDERSTVFLLVLLSETIQGSLTAETHGNDNDDFDSDQ